jgi:hypothetical protein
MLWVFVRLGRGSVTPNDNQRILYRTVCSLNLAKNYDEAAKQMLVLKALGRGIQNGLDSALIARQVAVTATGQNQRGVARKAFIESLVQSSIRYTLWHR